MHWPKLALAWGGRKGGEAGRVALFDDDHAPDPPCFSSYAIHHTGKWPLRRRRGGGRRQYCAGQQQQQQWQQWQTIPPLPPSLPAIDETHRRLEICRPRTPAELLPAQGVCTGEGSGRRCVRGWAGGMESGVPGGRRRPSTLPFASHSTRGRRHTSASSMCTSASTA